MNLSTMMSESKLINFRSVTSHLRMTTLITTCLFMLISPPVFADQGSVSNEVLTEALKEIKRVDGKGRAFSYSIAIVGTVIGLGIGGWALHQQPIRDGDHPDMMVLGSSILIAGTGLSQILHGGMRYDERRVSAEHAGALLKDLPAKKESAVLFLRDRAAEAQSTRFWGAVMTTAQGVGTVVLGGRLWAKGQGGIQTTGIVMTVLGALNIGVGAVHFFGKTRSGRILDRVLKTKTAHTTLKINPTLLSGDQSMWVPGLSAVGTF